MEILRIGQRLTRTPVSNEAEGIGGSLVLFILSSPHGSLLAKTYVVSHLRTKEGLAARHVTTMVGLIP